MIDEFGKPYLKKSQASKPFVKTEVVSLPDGSTGTSQTLIKLDDKRWRDYDLEANGWFKRLNYSEIAEKEVYRPIPSTMDFERVKVLVVKNYEIDINQAPCLACGNADYVYVRNMPSFPVRRCFRHGITISFPNAVTTKKAFKFMGEKQINNKEAIDLVKSGAFCDLSLRQKLGLPASF